MILRKTAEHVAHYEKKNIFNVDQSKFCNEIHSSRTLRMKEQKKIIS